jgi:hypothetical protein
MNQRLKWVKKKFLLGKKINWQAQDSLQPLCLPMKTTFLLTLDRVDFKNYKKKTF